MTNGMVNTVNPTFGKAPEPFNGIDMGVASNVHPGCVMDSAMDVSRFSQLIIASKFIGIHCGTGKHMLSDVRHEGRCFNIGSDFRDDISLALYHAMDDSLPSGSPTSLARSPSPEIRLVCFYLSIKRVQVFIQEPFDLCEYPPRSFIRNKLPAR